MKYLSNIDLNRNELQNARIQNLATAPKTPVEGQIYYNTVDKVIYQWNGTAWVAVGGGEIDTIKVNGAALPIVDKTVDLVIPSYNENDGSGSKIFTAIDSMNNPNYFIIQRYSSGEVHLIWRPYEGESVRHRLIDKAYVDTIVADYLELAGGTMSGDIAMGGNSITGLADPTDDSDAATKGYVDTLTVGAYQPAGSYAFADLPAPSTDTFHKMYDVTDDFTATADFIDSEVGLEYPAGTNVAVVNVGTEASPVYKYDALTGIVDLSDYPTKTEVNSIIAYKSEVLSASGTATSKTMTYSGLLIEAYAVMNGERVMMDISQVGGSNKSVTFSAASIPPSDVECILIQKIDLT